MPVYVPYNNYYVCVGLFARVSDVCVCVVARVEMCVYVRAYVRNTAHVFVCANVCRLDNASFLNKKLLKVRINFTEILRVHILC